MVLRLTKLKKIMAVLKSKYFLASIKNDTTRMEEVNRRAIIINRMIARRLEDD